MREAEQVASAEIVGVDVVEFLGLPDGVLEYGVPLRRAICAVVRRHRPEIVITNNFRDTWGGRNLNQADHIATGKATLDAVRDAGNRWVFPEQIDAGLGPWGGVREVWAASLAAGRARRRHDRDLRRRGVESLRGAPAYIEGLGWEHFDPEEFLEGGARPAGTRLGVPMATTFEVFPMGWGSTDSSDRGRTALVPRSGALVAPARRDLTHCRRHGVTLALFEHAF